MNVRIDIPVYDIENFAKNQKVKEYYIFLGDTFFVHRCQLTCLRYNEDTNVYEDRVFDIQEKYKRSSVYGYESILNKDGYYLLKIFVSSDLWIEFYNFETKHERENIFNLLDDYILHSSPLKIFYS